MERKEIKAMLASKRKGEDVISQFFKTTSGVLKMSDMNIYNKAVEATGYTPVFTPVAMYLLDYIATLKYLYSNPALLAATNKLKEEVLEHEKENQTNT